MRIVSTLVKIVSGILILFLLLILFIRSPWGQGIIKDKFVSYLSEKTATTISLDRLYITFTGDLTIEELFIQDLSNDTLLYSKYLSADIPIWPILTGGGIAIDKLDWDGVRANINRYDEQKGYNFEFLLAPFIPSDSIPSEDSDSTSSGLNLSIGTIHLNDIILEFEDQVSGINSSLNLGFFEIEMGKTDFQSMIFEINTAELQNSRLSYIQTKPFPETDNEEITTIPYLALKDIQLADVTGFYQSIPDGIDANLEIQDFALEAPVVDIANNRLNINNIELFNSVMNLYLTENQPTNRLADNSANPEEPLIYEWPAWLVNFDNIELENNDLTFVRNNEKPVSGHFNANAIALHQLTMKANQLFLKDQTAGGQLNQLSFQEGSGLSLEQFKFFLKMDNQHLDFVDLQINTQQSQLKGDFSAEFASIQSLINRPENTSIDLNLSDIVIDIEESFLFQPDIQDNAYVQALAEKPFTGQLNINGKILSLNISDAGIHWGNQTALFASGKLYNPMNPDQLRFDFPTVVMKSTRDDINKFMHEDSLGIRFPLDTRIRGDLSGDMSNISVEAFLESTLGQIDIKGNLGMEDTIQFSSDIKVADLRLDTIFQMPEIGSLSLSAEAMGQGLEINTLDATFSTTIEKFSYNNYKIHDLGIEGSFTDGSGNIFSEYVDSNLNVNLNALVLLDSIYPEINVAIELLKADLAALGVIDKKVTTNFLLDGKFKGNANTFNSFVTLKDGFMIHDEQSYPIGQIDLKAHVTPDTTSGSIRSRMVDFTLASNTSPDGFITALTDHLQSYIADDTLTLPDSNSSDVQVLVYASLRNDPLISEIFLTGLQDMDTMKMKVDYREMDRTLMANIDVPYLNYSGVEVDSIGLSAESDPENFNLKLGLRKIIAGPLTINRTYFTNEVRQRVLYSHFQAQYKNKELVHFKTETSQHQDSIRIHFDPSDLVFDSKDWHIPSTNLIRIGEDKIEFSNFNLKSGEQQLTIDDNPGMEALNIRFDQFNIASIISYLNPDSLLATGNMNGLITLEEPLGNSALLSDIQINSLNIMNVDFGDLSLYGETEDAMNYEANINLKGGEIDMTGKGEYHSTENDSEVLLDVSIDRISMKTIESFSMGSIENSQGFIKGEVNINGALTDILYNGQLSFNEVSLTPSLLQTPFYLGNQQIVFDNEGINLNSFSISDKDGNSFTVNGEIIAQDILNPTFDLSMEANDFQILNASQEDNSLVYGNASFDADATLTGNLNLPVLELNLEIGSGTDVTYVMPQGEAALNKKDGIVEFVNKESPVEKNPDNDEDTVIVRGYDINALISVNNEARFTVLISEQTGDNFQIAGDGDLNFGIDPTGRMTLTGIYTLQDGHYEMNLYNLVNRRFEIAEGSTVSWSGDPFDAKMDVQAIYSIESSPASLMANQISGSDASVQNQYNRKLPFLVYLNVDGQLTEPRLSFELDMPEDERGAMGGQVYGRIQQINADDQLINKQVFSLLVLGRFYPDLGSDGSSGGIANVARENLNQALSDQLNMFSDKLLGDTGLELNFDLESYTDYQGSNSQNRTQLDIAAQKKFLDDRLIINVGSEVDIEGSNSDPQEENPLIGNVSVEYLLTENGQFRLRGFRKNVFENVIDGQTIVSGLALIFTREFNQFNDLWKPMIREDKNNSEKK